MLFSIPGAAVFLGNVRLFGCILLESAFPLWLRTPGKDCYDRSPTRATFETVPLLL